MDSFNVTKHEMVWGCNVIGGHGYEVIAIRNKETLVAFELSKVTYLYNTFFITCHESKYTMKEKPP